MNETILRQVQTPAYVFAANEVRERFQMIRAALGPKIRLVYAVKANPFLIGPLMPLADGFELCSPGEERVARKLGVPGSGVVLSGVNKDEAHVRDAMGQYREEAVYTVESPAQMALINRLAEENGCQVRVLLRLSSGNQFGMDRETVRGLIRSRASYPNLMVLGIQYFSGTQKKKRVILKEIDEVDDFICGLREEFRESTSPDVFLSEMEFGPGLPVTYFTAETPIDDAALLAELREKLENMRFRGGITLEMGRYIAAYCGYYLTKVADAKTNDDTRFAIVDGGIHQVNYYGQMMAMKVPFIRVLQGCDSCSEGEPDADTGLRESSAGKAPETDDETVGHMICGSLCTTADVLVREFTHTKLRIGDILVFERAGAYSVTEGISLFLSRDLPRVYLYDEDKLTLARDRILTEEFNTTAPPCH